MEDKDYFRNLVWAAMAREGIARYKRVLDRIPDFHGADAAAQREFALPVWQQANTIKSNPDRPLRSGRPHSVLNL